MSIKKIIFTLLLIGSFLLTKNALASPLWSLCSLDDGSKHCGDTTYKNDHPTLKCDGNYNNLDECLKLETGQTVFWYVCPTSVNKVYTCEKSKTTNCSPPLKTKQNCINGIKTLNGTFQEKIDSKTAIDVAAKKAAAAAAEAKAAAEEETLKQEKEANKKAAEEEVKNASELVCDCSVKGDMQCKDDFKTTQEALDYCNACGIEMPQSSAVGCPLGSTETGPFACSCGTGKTAKCVTYDTFSELKKKCIGSCGQASGACPIDPSISLENLKKDAADKLNPARFLLGTAGVRVIIGRLINFLLYPIGMFTMALYIWAGFLWMIAQGNSEKVTKAKQILVWTTLGVVITLASYLIVDLVFSQIL